MYVGLRHESSTCDTDATVQAVLWESQHTWSGTDTAIVRVLFVMSYLLSAAYIGFSIVLLCFKSAFAHEYPYNSMQHDAYTEEYEARANLG